MSDNKYYSYSEQQLARETEKRLKLMKQLLIEIRDLLKTAGGIE